MTWLRELAVGSMLCVLGAAPALAQTAGMTPDASEAAGASSGLGASHRFSSAAAATAHCPGDAVVWSKPGSKSYILSAAPSYGKGSGFYACKAEADGAGFQAGS